ncbi:Transport ATP-binding protein CydD [Clostridiaceae bacterium JG1575]|nr:Transport ATP-binding protein CydD [Clostridiaceae bacterium JG1575]
MINDLMDYGKPQRAHLYWALLDLLISSLAWVAAFLVGARLIDLLLKDQMSWEQYPLLIGALLLALFLRAVLKSRGLLHSHIFAYSALGAMRRTFAQKMVENPLGATLAQPAGHYRQKMVDSIEQIEILLAHGIPEGVPYAISSFLIFLLIFLTDWRLGFLALVPVVLSMIFLFFLYKNSLKKMVKYYEASKNMSGHIVTFIGGIEVIKIFNRKSSSYEKMKTSVEEYRDFTLNWFRESWTIMAIVFSLAPTVILLVLPVGMRFVAEGSLSMTRLIFASLLAFAAAVPVMKLQLFFPVISQLAQKLKDLKKEYHRVPLKTGQIPVKEGDWSISYQGVGFSYEDQQVLHEIHLEIPSGQKVALVGESGSGKSTLAKLLLHYYDVNEGSISLGGVPMTSLDQESLMDHISYVSQDNFLFDTTIRENLLIGKPGASEEDLRAATRAAHIDEFIASLPQGYETRVGDCGNKLSGGEKQRLCIARALIKEAPIVVLDEATSFTDPENEYYIDQAIAALCKDRTVIIIAHKLSRIRHADQILLLDHGRIVSRGTHEELLKDPLYRRLWQRSQRADQFEFQVKEAVQ